MKILGLKKLVELVKGDIYVVKKYEFRDFYEVFIDDIRSTTKGKIYDRYPGDEGAVMLNVNLIIEKN